MFSIQDCISQLATPVSIRESHPSRLSTTHCEEKRGEGERIHFINPYVNKTFVYKDSNILRAATQMAKKACLKGFGNLVVSKGKVLSRRFP
ncbi:hypothetical protein AVEN_171731-1 [Araneus ventricosus]|uniref:Uncharacterized protein n=1 Tax=Araneus ventricosus TaxID=182803 RepID=A0A4Y2LIP7_ARAVE|nr:hypothetical protein AVEN_171731-1 [Araneus ventricosus]